MKSSAWIFHTTRLIDITEPFQRRDTSFDRFSVSCPANSGDEQVFNATACVNER